MKHGLSLTIEELVALRDRLVPLRPMDYDLRTFSILRNLYGRIDRILLHDPEYPPKAVEVKHD